MKKLFCLLSAVIILLTAAFPVNALASRITDNADIFSSSAEAELENVARRIKQNYSTDIVILTESDVAKYEARDYVIKYYENECEGDTGGGVVLFISMKPGDRNYYILTEGTAADIYERYVGDCKSLVERNLRAGNYEKAASDFLGYTERVLSADPTSGSPYQPSKTDNSKNTGQYVLISVGISFVIALISVLVMRGGMKTVKPARSAGNYIVGGSTQIRDKNIIYVRSHVTSTRRASSSSSSGGGHSSGHYGGGGGSF